MANAGRIGAVHDVLSRAAAGNTGGQVLYPLPTHTDRRRFVDQDLTRSDFSSFGAEIDLMAPDAISLP